MNFLKVIKVFFIVVFYLGFYQATFAQDDSACSSLLHKILVNANSKDSLALGKNKQNVIDLLHTTLPDGKIEPREAHELISNNQDHPDLIILDVRKKGEFDAFHIQGAKNIDFSSDDFKEQIIQLDRSKIYILNCACGFRGHKAQKIMTSLDFEHTFNMVGGIDAWDDISLPTIDNM